MQVKTETAGHKRVTILIDGEPWREVSLSIFGKKCRLPPPTDAQEEWERAFDKLERERAMRYAAFLLSKCDTSTQTIRQKLERKGVSPKAVESVVEELVSKGYLNDDRYAEAIIRSCRARGLGEGRIKSHLQLKGLSPQSLEGFPNDDPNEVASRAWQQIAKRYNLADPKGRQRAYAAMARRGFDWEMIKQVSHQ